LTEASASHDVAADYSSNVTVQIYSSDGEAMEKAAAPAASDLVEQVAEIMMSTESMPLDSELVGAADYESNNSTSGIDGDDVADKMMSREQERQRAEGQEEQVVGAAVVDGVEGRAIKLALPLLVVGLVLALVARRSRVIGFDIARRRLVMGCHSDSTGGLHRWSSHSSEICQQMGIPVWHGNPCAGEGMEPGTDTPAEHRAQAGSEGRMALVPRSALL
jgi:hypothetical protein